MVYVGVSDQAVVASLQVDGDVVVPHEQLASVEPLDLVAEGPPIEDDALVVVVYSRGGGGGVAVLALVGQELEASRPNQYAHAAALYPRVDEHHVIVFDVDA